MQRVDLWTVNLNFQSKVLWRKSFSRQEQSCGTCMEVIITIFWFLFVVGGFRWILLHLWRSGQRLVKVRPYKGGWVNTKGRMRDKRQEIIIIKQHEENCKSSRSAMVRSRCWVQSHKIHEDARRTSGIKNAVLRNSASTSPKQGPLRYLLGYWRNKIWQKIMSCLFTGVFPPGPKPPPQTSSKPPPQLCE